MTRRLMAPFRWEWWFRVFERLASSMLVLPATAAVGGFLTEDALLQLGRSFRPPEFLVFETGAATSVLTTIVGAMMTVTGIVFSVLTLTVQYAGGAVSPRVVRTFYRDRVVKGALSTFVFTFTYSLVLIPNATDEGSGLAVGVAIMLAVVSLVVFLVLVNHVGQGIRPASMVTRVGTATRKAIDTVHPKPATSEHGAVTKSIEGRAITHRGEAGVIMAANAKRLNRYAARRGATIEMIPQVGDFLDDNSPLFIVSEGDRPLVDDRLRALVAVGVERTIDQDPAFGLRILVDTAVKALSPGVNDPTSAVVALDQIHSILRQLAVRDLEETRALPNLIAPSPGWDGYLDLALIEIRFYGADAFQVTRRLRSILLDLQRHGGLDRQVAIERHLDALDKSVAAAHDVKDDRTYASAADQQGIGASPSAPHGTGSGE